MRIDGDRQDVATRIAVRLVRTYPTPWRARYENEVLQLLQDSGVRWRDIGDLTRGLLTERALSLFEPGDHPVATSATLTFLSIPVAITCWVLGALAGAALRTALGPVRLADSSFLTALLAVVGVWLQIVWLSRYCYFSLNPFAAATSSPSPQPQWSDKLVRIGLLWFCGVFLNALLLNWPRSQPLLSSPFPLFVLFTAGMHLPLHRLYPEIRFSVIRLQELRRQLKWARLELTRCESLQEQGSPSPLEEARTAVRRLEEQQADALATLHGMGYRARFPSV